MPQTTSNVGRSQVAFPDRGYDAQGDGGVALHAALTTTIKSLSDNAIGRWYDNFTLGSTASTNLVHNFSLALTSIKVLIMESGVLKTQAEVTARYTISQISTSTIQITNISGGSISNIQVYIIGFPLGVKSADLDASIDATITRLRFTGGVLLNEMSSPSTPTTGQVAVYAKSDKKLYVKDSNGTESQVGSGSGGGSINYITNSDFENGLTTGWVTYADAAGSTPVDGTGGSPNITFVASNTSPLRGTYSGLLTKDAANRQGQGISFDFTINSVDCGKTLQISYDAITSSVTSGDLVCYVYDITNASLITPSQPVIPTGTSSQYSIAFNSTTSTSYRLIFHVATTSATAYTMKIDNISISPIVRPVVAGIGDLNQTFTPTSSWVTNTTHSGIYGRVGDRYVGQIKLALSGAPNSATLTNISLPFTIDTTKLLSGTTTGVALPNCSVTIKSAGVTYTSSSVWYVSTTTIQPTYDNGSGVATAITQAAPGTFASGDYIQIDFDLPATNISSNITLATTTSALQFVSNSSTSDANDTSSFTYGVAGSPLPGTLTSLRTKRVQLSSPYNSIDDIDIYIIPSGETIPLAVRGLIKDSSGTIIASRLSIQNTTTYGIDIQPVSGSKTQIDVVFGQYSHPSGATFASAGSDWVSANGNWFIKDRSSIGAAELAPANIISQGTVAYSQFTSYINPGSSNLGTLTNDGIRYRREGDCLRMRGKIQLGSVTAGLGSLTLPLGLSIDSTKINGNRADNFGIFTRCTPSNLFTSSNSGYCYYDSGVGLTAIAFANSGDGTGSTGLNSQNANVVFNSTEVVMFDVLIPISGWN